MNFIHPIIGTFIIFLICIIVLKVFKSKYFIIKSLVISCLYFLTMIPTIYNLNQLDNYHKIHGQCKISKTIIYDEFNTLNRYNPLFISKDNTLHSTNCELLTYCYKTSATYSLFNKCIVQNNHLKKGASNVL